MVTATAAKPSVLSASVVHEGRHFLDERARQCFSLTVSKMIVLLALRAAALYKLVLPPARIVGVPAISA